MKSGFSNKLSAGCVLFEPKTFVNTDYMINGRIKVVATHKVYSTITNYDISNSDFIVIDLSTISNIRELRESGLLGSFDNVSLDAKLEILINAIPREIPIEQRINIPDGFVDEVATTTIAVTEATSTEAVGIDNATTTLYQDESGNDSKRLEIGKGGTEADGVKGQKNGSDCSVGCDTEGGASVDETEGTGERTDSANDEEGTEGQINEVFEDVSDIDTDTGENVNE